MNNEFSEVHKMDTLYPLLLISITAVANAIVYFAVKLYELDFFYVTMTAASVLTSFFLIMKLNIRMDATGIKYNLFPIHWKSNFIPLENIKHIFVRTYKPIQEYGGWGIRMGTNGRAYSVQGTQGIQIELNDGKKILLGTDKPVEWEYFLQKYHKNLTK